MIDKMNFSDDEEEDAGDNVLRKGATEKFKLTKLSRNESESDININEYEFIQRKYPPDTTWY